MSVSQRLITAASRVLAGDDSRAAGEEILGVLIEDYDDLNDPRIDDLVEGLALYGPGEGPPYLDPPELRRLVRASLLALGFDGQLPE